MLENFIMLLVAPFAILEAYRNLSAYHQSFEVHHIIITYRLGVKKTMAQLEYRLFDEEKGYPALYHYDAIPKEEIVMRFLCDYLVKDGVVYEKTSNAMEANLHVIYVKLANDEIPVPINRRSTVGMGFIVMEIREYREDALEYPIINNLELSTLTDLALIAQCNYLMLEGVEWEQTSLEVDEDRQTYVFYAKRTI